MNMNNKILIIAIILGVITIVVAGCFFARAAPWWFFSIITGSFLLVDLLFFCESLSKSHKDGMGIFFVIYSSVVICLLVGGLFGNIFSVFGIIIAIVLFFQNETSIHYVWFKMFGWFCKK